MSPSTPTVVFDSTVLISAFLVPHGTAGKLLGRAGQDFVVALSPEIVEEVRGRLLTKPSIRKSYAYADERVHSFCRGIVANSVLVQGPPALTGVVRDPNDDMVVACAVAAGAAHIITRDKDLLALGSYDGIGIITPHQFLSLLPPG